MKAPSASIAIVGLPNTGKSHVFNLLTGEYAVVANYPHTTVEVRRTTANIGIRPCTVFDTPGLHSLYIHSEEEIVVRDMLFTQKPDVLVQCMDAGQAKQSLALTADLLGLGLPMVIILTAVDETVRRGIRVDTKALSQALGVPVVAVSSIRDPAGSRIAAAIGQATAGPAFIDYGEEIEQAVRVITPLLPDDLPFKRKTATLLLEDDRTMYALLTPQLNANELQTLDVIARDFRQHFDRSVGRALNETRNRWVDSLYSRTVNAQGPVTNRFLQRFTQFSRQPLSGIPILAGFIALTYILVVHVAGLINTALNTFIVDPTVATIGRGIPIPWLRAFLVGDYGILTLGLFNAFCTVLPILSIFFLLFGFMEDIGYIPNLCVLTNRLFNAIGITGRSIMPLVLGFGCKTMATLTTRGLTSRKEKYIAIYLIAFAIPCSAQLGLNMAILGKAGIAAFAIAVTALIFVEVLAGVVLNRIIKDDTPSSFIQELPPLRVPDLRAILVKTYYRLKWFLKEAVPIFLIAAVVLFLLDLSGGLQALKVLMRPVVSGWLGLPIDMVDALILTMARHEAAAGLILKMADAGQLNFTQSIVAVVITTMFVPCFANIVAMCREVGLRSGLIMTAAINISAFILAGLLYHLLIVFP